MIDVIGGESPALVGGSAPSAASVGAPGLTGSMILFGYTDQASGLYRQEFKNAWRTSGQRASNIEAQPIRPGVVAMSSGEFDMISAYVLKDGLLHASTRTAFDRGSTWSADAIVHASARPLDGAIGTGLADGRALYVYRDAAKKGWYTVFDPAKTPRWATPKELVAGGNPALTSLPHLVQDRCGADATLAYVDAGGNASLLRFEAGAWKGPFPVKDLRALTYMTVAASP